MAVERLEAIARLIRRSGRQVVIVIAPDKSTIYPEHIDTEAAGELWDCAAAGRRVLWPLLESSRDPGLVGLRGDLLRAKQITSDPVFRRTDSHWNAVGASVGVREILERFGSRVRMQPGELRAAPAQTYTGDLTVLLGAPETDTTAHRVVRRDARAPVLPGTTLMFPDSFANVLGPLLAPYVRTLNSELWDNHGPDAMWEMIGSADRVIIEIVERELNPPLADAARFTLLLDKLRSSPLPRRR